MARLDDRFASLVLAIFESKGNVVVSGVGKPYFIAQKISASMASTGTPSIPLHPVDALHGDMGRIRDGDILLIFSNSGASPEVVSFVESTQHLDLLRVAVTCRPESQLARISDIVIDLGELKEAGNMGVAPSTTSTAMLAFGDAMTLALCDLREFSLESFAQNHPKGQLGRQLGPVGHVMRGIEKSVLVGPEVSLAEVMQKITLRRCGCALVVGAEGKLLGLFTDGDLRRSLTEGVTELSRPVGELMTNKPHSIGADVMVAEALDTMRTKRVNTIPVVDERSVVLGHLDIQDLA